MASWLAISLLAALGFQRLIELALSKANQEALEAKGAWVVHDDVYGLIVGLHGVFFILFALEALLAPWAGTGWWTLPGLAVFVVGQGLRHWSMEALGPRWTTRIVVLPRASKVTTGPYRWMDHPIYLGVGLELLALPLAFGLVGTALVATLFNLPLLYLRIQAEEDALAEAAGERTW